MRKIVLLAASLLLVLGVVPAGAADATSGVACTDTDGRERLTLDGFQQTIEAPAPYPSLSAPADTATPGQPVQAYRRAVYQFTLDLAPAAEADLTVALDWAEFVDDYDVFITDDDDEGFEIGRSATDNPGTQTAGESAVVEDLPHCARITVAVTNFTGRPGQPIDLSITAEGRDTLSCTAGDTAPGCAGKAAGEAPVAVADGRTLLYLAGDPGQGSMVHTQAGAEPVPFRSALSSERPTGAQPNSYTAPPVGFNTARNPFKAFFETELDTTRHLLGDVTALVWVSSPTMADGGTLFAHLLTDGGIAATVEIPGEGIGTSPTAVPVAFPDVDIEADSVGIQLSTEPVASSSGTTGNTADASFTVHYGSVQFPARLTLP